MFQNAFTPFSFREAWESAMSRSRLREWLFNRAPPTKSELLQCQENPSTFTSLSVVCKKGLYQKLNEDLLQQYCSLQCGTSLGFAFSSTQTDHISPGIALIDPIFQESRVSVRRLAISTCEGRLFAFEFNWLVTGALTMRFIPVGAPLTSTNMVSGQQGNAFAHIFVFAFIPEDANVLSVCADVPTNDFFAANFSALGISDRCYRISMYDTSFQSPCVFCLSRGAATCECPMPLRRRKLFTPDAPQALMTYSVNQPGVLWPLFSRIVVESRTSGSYVYNQSMGCRGRGGTGHVRRAGIFRYAFSNSMDLSSNATLQLQLRQVGCSQTSPYSVVTYAHAFPGGQASLAQFSSIPDRANTDDRMEQPATGSHAQIQQRAHQMPFSSDFLLEFQAPEFGGAAEDAAMEAMCEALSIPTSESSSEEVPPQTKKRLYKCDICGIEIQSKKSNLKRHIQNKHGTVRRIACHAEGCGMSFENRLDLTRHREREHQRC